MRTRLTIAIICWYNAVQSFCHSIRAASRLALYVFLEFRCRSLLKWLKFEKWIDPNPILDREKSALKYFKS